MAAHAKETGLPISSPMKHANFTLIKVSIKLPQSHMQSFCFQYQQNINTPIDNG